MRWLTVNANRLEFGKYRISLDYCISRHLYPKNRMEILFFYFFLSLVEKGREIICGMSITKNPKTQGIFRPLTSPHGASLPAFCSSYSHLYKKQTNCGLVSYISPLLDESLIKLRMLWKFHAIDFLYNILEILCAQCEFCTDIIDNRLIHYIIKY